MRRLAIVLAAAAASIVFACSSDDDHTHSPTTFPACEEIAEACHEKDTGSGKPHECHESSESATTEAACTAIKADCLAACSGSASDGGTSTDAPTGG